MNIESILGIPINAFMGQLLMGLMNGAFYAMLSLGLAIIFGLLNVINFLHGAQFMVGAFIAWMLLAWAGLSYWVALLVAPLVVAIGAVFVERLFLRHLYRLDHLYGMLLTFGLMLMVEGLFRKSFGSSGLPYPNVIPGGMNLGFMFLPYYRAWVVAASLLVCLAIWLLIEKTRLGSYLRAATENPDMVRAFGIKVPVLLTLTYAFGAGLAGLAGVMAAPIYQVSPLMGSNLVILVFAVVVIGGMGSILGSILTGFSLGAIEGLTKLFYPQASATVIFLVMIIVLLIKPTGLFGKAK
ncbi:MULTISPECIES: branched-chain amino acid ABC transporter permease [Bordetella]|uniref:High-affinity branched-chain amino acid transporter membrane protein n=4 Tax=Bordetella TaxID=517 RepID=K0MCN8_BORPB|nr:MULTISPECIES: branched-chain amino acid ABC transporter permease [Bordetella]KAK68569.1 branched-chain amino acid ABC transporter, permease protein [Bordetella bronchiseptica 980-2]KCV29254.1 branched-chain amino acid ABC transporter, permease protein [Bordetella bronchiseptica 00-P-2730]KDD55453.1 branched-chain amino acid ABC transporter, permease protein [Bordetella bronchiseptica OSU553]SHS62504.1 ABC-type branched-chain amino acid transport system, permease protein I [Mycobacteroides ab